MKNIQSSLDKMSKDYGYNFTPNQKAALTSFMYNLGIDSFKQLTKNGKRSKEEIGKKMLAYNRAGGKRNKGLVKRRKKENQLYFA